MLSGRQPYRFDAGDDNRRRAKRLGRIRAHENVPPPVIAHGRYRRTAYAGQHLRAPISNVIIERRCR